MYTAEQLTILLNAGEYSKILTFCNGRRNADETYFYGLALDQIAAVKKNAGEQHQGQLEQALRIAETGVARFENDFRFLFLKALVLLHSDKSSEALKLFTLLYRKTRDKKYLTSIANAQRAMGKYRIAIHNYKKVYKDGSPFVTLHNIASMYVLMGKMSKARKIAKKGLTLKASNVFEKTVLDALKKIALKD